MAISLARRVCHWHGKGLNNGGGGSRNDGGSGRGSAVAVHFGLGTVARDVTSLAASVAGLTRGVERSAIGSGAVTRNVTELATGVALHSLGLAVAREVVWSAALVAGRRATAAKSAPEASSCVSSAGSGCTPAHSTSAGVRAVASQMARETARVAASAGASSAQAQSRAVRLDMAEALAVVALLCFGGARVGASVRLVAGLLA
ncbi:hypothetical protein P280DRAFT_102032 [Massarina eburnea CBS 473.64]|uniref:Uncharacterized protein n=1 Tax=Massarina eburnea CBS 473.64 TaxID=1395130 RepID=A0A6A6RTP4_9PLEO|nr:hypothetical protein P280DRAFT_102032 [Massarina eburnea CBS 473.64]